MEAYSYLTITQKENLNLGMKQSLIAMISLIISKPPNVTEKQALQYPTFITSTFPHKFKIKTFLQWIERTSLHSRDTPLHMRYRLS